MRTWTFPECRPPGGGPWTSEPDKAQWVDEATGLDCLIVRANTGALCGYVGVPAGHPWHGQRWTEAPAIQELHVHGGVNYSDPCVEGGEQAAAVCHVPEPGRPDDVWWLGFDCSHVGDYAPTHEAELSRILPQFAEELAALAETGAGDLRGMHRIYRDFAYVTVQVTSLAAQVHRAGF